MSPFLQSIAQEWELVDLSPLAETSASSLLAGFQGTQPIVLKLSSDEAALEREAAALHTFAGHGAVEVRSYQPGALLLERVTPGFSLGTLSHSQSPVQIACEVMKRLHQAPPPKASFPTMDEWLQVLDVEWDLPASYLKRARNLRDHYGPSVNPVLLHGDLHRGNILARGGDWVAIDPKGIMGDPIHEVWAFIEKPEEEIPWIAQYFNFDPQAVWDWSFVHAVLAACWCCEDRLDPARFLALAERVLSCRPKLLSS